MTKNRDIPADIKKTNEILANKENVVPQEKSWLGHTEGGGVLDYELLKGATLNELALKSQRENISVNNHFDHLKYEHGVIVEEKNGVYKISGTKISTMLTYKEYEKKVYDWLLSNHQKDNNFTFSVRKKASKGSETDYFIGTEKANYFGITFWTMPGGFPGSSGDIIDLLFSYDQVNYDYKIEFTQTNSPDDTQNKSILNLLKSLKEPISNAMGLKYESPPSNKMFTIIPKTGREKYTSFEEMLVDVENDLNIIFPIVDQYIEIEKESNPEFKAHRITQDEFKTMQDKMHKRFAKYSSIVIDNNDSSTIKERFSEWLKGSETGNKVNSYLRAIDILNEILNTNIYLETNIRDLNALYQNLIKEQHNKEGKYYYPSAPSYGNNGFYSASVKAFIDFLRDESKEDEIFINKELSYNPPLNQILYGPPGTGKTYKLQNEYFDLFSIKEANVSRKQFLTDLISDLTWFQVICIAVLDIQTPNVSEIFKHEFVKIKAELSNSKSIRQTIWNQLQSHTILDCPNVKVEKRYEPLLFYKRKNSTWTVDHNVLNDFFPESFNILEKSKNYVPNITRKIKNYEFVTFHQSFSYEDFVEGIKPIMDEDSDELKYEIKDGVFKKLCLRAKADPNNNYAIFIDEINRGNVSSIFGELITLIEEDKRLGGENQIKVILPYSKEEFGVPGNLYIMGTMNTADRSVEALDTALRRRFSFVEVNPKPGLLESHKIIYNTLWKYQNVQWSDQKWKYVEEGLDELFGFNENWNTAKKDLWDQFKAAGYSLESSKELIPYIKNQIDLKEILKTINDRVELLVDRDHTIGHSYFINVTSKKMLADVFTNNVVPLLQEYFYGDYGKIGLVLGKGFVTKINNNNKNFASFEYEGQGDFKTPSFELVKVDEHNIIEAIHVLLGKSQVAESDN